MADFVRHYRDNINFEETLGWERDAGGAGAAGTQGPAAGV